MSLPSHRQQLDLLTRAPNQVDESRLPLEIQENVALLLKLMMAEYVACARRSGETVDE